MFQLFSSWKIRISARTKEVFNLLPACVFAIYLCVLRSNLGSGRLFRGAEMKNSVTIRDRWAGKLLCGFLRFQEIEVSLYIRRSSRPLVRLISKVSEAFVLRQRNFRGTWNKWGENLGRVEYIPWQLVLKNRDISVRGVAAYIPPFRGTANFSGLEVRCSELS